MRFFSEDNFVFRFCGQLFDLVLLSAAWAILCIPIFTIGPATAALYYAVVKCVRRKEPDALRNFFSSFKANFKTGAAAGLLVTACALLLLAARNAVTVMAQAGSVAAVVLYYAQGLFLLFLFGLACWLAPVLSRFTVTLGGLLRSALVLGVRHLPTTVVASLLTLEAAEFTLRYVYPVFIVPALAALLASLFYERVFQRYMGAGDEGGDDEKPWYLQ